MKVLIVGLPGSGKSTQVDNLSQHLKVNSIKMSGLLRKRAAQDDEMSRNLSDMMGRGVLVPDEIVSKMIEDEVEDPANKRGFVMEGYPRTVGQIKLFDPGFDKVFYLDIPIETAKERLMGRGREDDKEDVIETRLKVQMEDMEKILDYYREKLEVVNGTLGINEVSDEITARLN